jgi:hypothetical protein
MLTLFSRPARVRSEVGLIVRNSMTIHTQELVQTQYLSEHYVLTDVGRMLMLYWPERNQRFVVDRAKRELKTLDTSAQLAQVAQLKPALGEVKIERVEGEEEIDGYTCRRLQARNENAAIVFSGELFCTRLPELAGTALGREREFDERLQAFAMPLAADEIVVRATMKMLARGFEQNQRTDLLGVESRLEEFAELDRILSFKVVD